MDLYEVVITDHALKMLERYITYIEQSLFNPDAARSVWQDALRTRDRLSKVAGMMRFCVNDNLQKLGYRRVLFDNHDYVMIYHVDEEIAYVDAIYHQSQDYENLFSEYIGIG